MESSTFSENISQSEMFLNKKCKGKYYEILKKRFIPLNNRAL
jgi:hypothetical protein